MKFECHNGEHQTLIDATPEHGGLSSAPTPKELVLNAMMGCTAMDVVAILTKMRQDISSFSMEINAEKTKEYPVHFKTAELVFDLKGQLDGEKVIKAVDSSLTKYCGVNYMISKTWISVIQMIQFFQ
jgi:putative redox protein